MMKWCHVMPIWSEVTPILVVLMPKAMLRFVDESWRANYEPYLCCKTLRVDFCIFLCRAITSGSTRLSIWLSRQLSLCLFFLHLHSRSVEWCWEMLCAVEAIAVHLAWKLQEIISAVQSGLLGVALDGVPKRGAELAELEELWRISFKVEVSWSISISQVWTEHFVLNRASVPGRCKLGWHWSQLLMTRPEYDRESYGAS